MRTFLAVLFLFIAVGLGGVYAVLRTRSQPDTMSAPAAQEAPATEAAAPAPAEAPVAAVPAEPPVAPDPSVATPGGLGVSGVGEGGGGMGTGGGLGVRGAESGRLGGVPRAETTGASQRAFGRKTEEREAEAVARSLPMPEAAPVEVQAMAAPPPPPPPPTLAETFKAREVAYNRPPSKLVMGKPIEVSLAINATAKAGAAAEAVKGFEGEVVEREVELSDVVSAQLTGSGFHIESVTVERQKLSDRVANRWQWTVTPTEAGSQTLILEIFGYANGSADAEPLDAYRDTIEVEVEQMDVLLGLAAKYEPLFGFGAGVAGALSATFGLLRVIGGRKKA